MRLKHTIIKMNKKTREIKKEITAEKIQQN